MQQSFVTMALHFVAGISNAVDTCAMFQTLKTCTIRQVTSMWPTQSK